VAIIQQRSSPAVQDLLVPALVAALVRAPAPVAEEPGALLRTCIQGEPQ